MSGPKKKSHTKVRKHDESGIAAALVMARREGYLAACREPIEGGGVQGCAQMVKTGSCSHCEGAAARKFPLPAADPGVSS